MAEKECLNRRDFLGMALAGTAAVGAGATLVALKGSWDPLPSVVSAGFTTVDLSSLVEGECKTVEWRGKPVYLLKKTQAMEPHDDRDLVVGAQRYSVGIQICTHLGCVPSYSRSETKFKCACHGAVFDSSGINVSGPPKRPMDIPPFRVDGEKIVLGEEGPEYQKLVGKA